VASRPPERDAASLRRILHRDEAGVEFARVVAFSDGIFAIAMTLLVLAVEVPPNAGDLGQALIDARSDFFAYILSFAVLAKLWLAHHRFFGAVLRFDNALMALNLVYLGCVALVPVTTDLLGEYSGERAAVIVYAANMAAVTLTFTTSIIYAYRRNLMRPEMKQFERRFAGPSNFLVTGIFLLSIPVAFLSPDVATLMWLAIFLVGRQVADRVAASRAG
jgi:uncharacterized membrane protein